MSWRAAIIERLQQAYGFANSRGALRDPRARRLFTRAYFAYKRLVEDPFDGLVRRHPRLFQGGHVLDVGANVGYTASVFARAVSPGSKVFAFEPERDNFALLRDTVARLHLGEVVEPIEAAVGASDGVVQLWRNERHHGDHRVVTDGFQAESTRLGVDSVAQLSIDGFARARGILDAVRFIKIDVQGYEPAVLRGLAETVRRSPGAALAVEYMPSAIRELGFEPGDVVTAIRELGLVPMVLGSRGTVEPFAALEDRLAARGYVDLLCTRDGLLERGAAT